MKRTERALVIALILSCLVPVATAGAKGQGKLSKAFVLF
jgi:hypothetical protein